MNTDEQTIIDKSKKAVHVQAQLSGADKQDWIAIRKKLKVRGKKLSQGAVLRQLMDFYKKQMPESWQ